MTAGRGNPEKGFLFFFPLYTAQDTPVAATHPIAESHVRAKMLREVQQTFQIELLGDDTGIAQT